MKRTTQILIAIAIAALPAAVQAQELQAGMMQQAQSSMVIGPDQDSLLPPEVVPMDPTMAGQMSACQAQNRYNGGAEASAPGLAVQPGNPADMRRQAFESLYSMQNGGQVPQQQPFPGQWRSGQQPEQAPGMQPAGMYPMAQMPQGQQGAPVMQGGPTQSQTLTGGVKNQPVQQDTRRRGFSNVLSAATTFGAGALTSAVLMRPNNPWLGAGIFGMTMTGLGNRNSFRF